MRLSEEVLRQTCYGPTRWEGDPMKSAEGVALPYLNRSEGAAPGGPDGALGPCGSGLGLRGGARRALVTLV
jgi:hypothetical protein